MRVVLMLLLCCMCKRTLHEEVGGAEVLVRVHAGKAGIADTSEFTHYFIPRSQVYLAEEAH